MVMWALRQLCHLPWSGELPKGRGRGGLDSDRPECQAQEWGLYALDSGMLGVEEHAVSGSCPEPGVGNQASGILGQSPGHMTLWSLLILLPFLEALEGESVAGSLLSSFRPCRWLLG